MSREKSLFQCPQCRSGNQKITDSRALPDTVRRRRVCFDCGNRWTTYEYSKEYFEKINGELGKYRLMGQIIDELFHGGVNDD